MFWGWKRLYGGWKGLRESIGTHIGMSSVNVSINDKAYKVFKSRLQRKGESFSQTILRLGQPKDITRCFGLLKDEDDDTWEAVREEMERVRKYPMRGVIK